MTQAAPNPSDCEHDWVAPIYFEDVGATFCPKCNGNAIGRPDFIASILRASAKPPYYWLGAEAEVV